MGRIRALSDPIGTVLIGVFVGFILASIAGIFIQESGLFGSNAESPITRAYMLGLLQRDPNSMAGNQPDKGVAGRAADLQGAAAAQSTMAIQPISLTYLGGASVTGFSVHIYAVDIRTSEGTNEFWSAALTVRQSDHKVIRFE
jgi:hypothetical protein